MTKAVENTPSAHSYQTLLYEILQEIVRCVEERPVEKLQAVFSRLGHFLGFDRIGLILLTEDGLMAKQLISWSSENWLYDESTEFYSIAEYPWLMRQLRTGQQVTLATLDDIPPAAFSEREYFENYGIQAFAARPLQKKSEHGTLGFWHFDATCRSVNLDTEKLNMLAPLEEALLSILLTRERLSQQQALLQEKNLLLNHTDIQIWYMVNPTVYGSANEAHARFFGKQVVDMVQCEIYSVYSPDNADDFVQMNLEVFETKQPLQREFSLRNCQNQERILTISWNPILDENQEVAYLICSAHDITDLKQIQTELLEAKEASEVANIAKSQFLANMSHEIRTPIHGVMGFLELLKQTSSLSETQREYVEGAQTSSEVLLHIINDILDISKIEAGKYTLEEREFSLPTVIKNALSVITPKAREKNLRLSAALPEHFPQIVLGDSIRLEQILNNLLSNAVKFTHKGLISLALTLLEETPETVRYRFEVKDTGIGIAPDVLHRLFNPFTQADGSTTRKYGGTGLGLALSKELVTLMGGEIGVTSSPQEGSVFWFTITFNIPKDYSKVLDNQGIKKDPEFVLADSYTVYPRLLVVDDHPMNRKILSKLLEKRNVPCDLAEDGQQALTACLEKEYDIVFMDCQMPVMDGYASTGAIRQAEQGKKHTIIIAMTANAMAGDREKCLASGMDDYMSKPIQPAGVFAMIKKYYPELA